MLKCKWEKRLVKTLVLIRTSTSEKLESTGGDTIIDPRNGRYKNVPIATIGGPIYQNAILPFVDETKYTGLIDVDLNVNVRSINDIPALRKVLQQYRS